MIATLIKLVLQDCGFESFDIASSHDSAIAAADRRRPDLITADVMLSPGSGLDAVNAICLTLAVPVIFISARAPQIRASIADHAVLDKPFSEQTLGYVVAASLAGRRPPDRLLA